MLLPAEPLAELIEPYSLSALSRRLADRFGDEDRERWHRELVRIRMGEVRHVFLETADELLTALGIHMVRVYPHVYELDDAASAPRRERRDTLNAQRREARHRAVMARDRVMRARIDAEIAAAVARLDAEGTERFEQAVRAAQARREELSSGAAS